MCFISGYTIPKGWKVLVWFRSVHLDPEIYPNPKEFNPSRWDVSCRFVYLNNLNMLVNAYACHISIIIWSNDDVVVVSVNQAQNYTAKAGTFLPFGGGSRLCPGNDLAKLEITIFLHYFLLNYRWVILQTQTLLLLGCFKVICANIIYVSICKLDVIGWNGWIQDVKWCIYRIQGLKIIAWQDSENVHLHLNENGKKNKK